MNPEGEKGKAVALFGRGSNGFIVLQIDDGIVDNCPSFLPSVCPSVCLSVGRVRSGREGGWKGLMDVVVVSRTDG